MSSIMGNIQMLVYLILFLCAVMFYMRWRNNKICSENMSCRFVSDEGNGYRRFYPVVNGILHIPPDKKRVGAEYGVGNLTTYNVNYPEKVIGFMSIIQAPAKECLFDERTAEPLSNRTPLLLLTPQAIYNVNTERFTEQASGRSQLENKDIAKELGMPQRKSGGFNLKWVIILLIIAGLGVAGLLVYNHFHAAALAKAALGVP